MNLFTPVLLALGLLTSSAATDPAAGPAPATSAASAAAADGRVIFLGFDGADGRTAKLLMDQGQLPNLSKLTGQGVFSPLGTTNPAESPVSWASLNSGRNPAETAVVGFMRRDFLGPTKLIMPIKGLSNDGVEVPISEFGVQPGGGGAGLAAVIPEGWSPTMTGGVIGGAALLVFLVVFGLLLRLKAGPTVVLSAILAGIGFMAGRAMASGEGGAGGGGARAVAEDGERGLPTSLPETVPVVQNPVEVPAFWELAADAGVESIVLDAAQAWDREPKPGARVMCGLGVPDARGDYISFFVYTTDGLYFNRDYNDRKASTGSGGLKLRVDEKDGVVESVVLGPKNWVDINLTKAEIEALEQKKSEAKDFKSSSALAQEIKALEKHLDDLKDHPVSLPLKVVKQGDGTAEVTLGSETQTLSEGDWSDWYHLEFPLSTNLSVYAITRVRVVHMDDPHFELYVNAIEIDPAKPPFWQPISQPPEFSAELVEALGRPFETVGWSCMTHPFKDKIVDVELFMEDIEYTMRWREELTFKMLERDDWRLFVSLLSTPDRVQHMMYQYYDDQHPLYDAEEASRTMTFFGETIEMREAIPAIYRQVDRIVGRVMDEVLQPEDTLLIGADHGFQSFRRQVHINNWLAENGYLKTKRVTSSGQTTVVSSYVDWKETKAYSMGLGTVYLNLVGREPDGTVDPSEADALMNEIRTKFLAHEDPDNPGVKTGSEVYFAKDIHSGPFFELDADMFFCYAPNYRSSWATALGGISMKKQDDGTYALGPTVVDNDRMWSGDHVSVDPEHVKGMFFASRPLTVPEGGVDLLHIAPTVLSLLGVDVPSEMDLPPLAAQ